MRVFLAARAVLCVRVRIWCVCRKTAAVAIKPVCRRRKLWSPFFTDSAACVLSLYVPPFHYTCANSLHPKFALVARIIFFVPTSV